MRRLDSTASYSEDSADTRSYANEYGELKRLIKQSRLLDKQPGYYAFKVLITSVMLAGGVAFLVLVDSFWLQLLNAVYLAFVFGQISFIGHDTGHQQIFRSPRNNDIMGLLVNLVLGLSRTWWVDKHNRHHSNPNQLSLDPDTFIPVLAYSEEQALGKRGLYRLTVKYQSYIFLPLLSLEGVGVRLAGAQYLLHRRAKYAITEPLLMALHMVPYVGVPIYLLGPWQGLVFLVIHQLLFGLYLGSVFAPNHKGMPVLEEEDRMDFLKQQVMTSRNVKSHPIVDFWYGGLNYQIEHHLFPTMPRNRLREAQKIVKGFCKTHSIPYYETGILRSYQEILQYLHQVSAPLRAADRKS